MTLTKERAVLTARTHQTPIQRTQTTNSSLPLLLGISAIILGGAALVVGSGENVDEVSLVDAGKELDRFLAARKKLPKEVADHLSALGREAHAKKYFLSDAHPLWTEVLEFLEAESEPWDSTDVLFDSRSRCVKLILTNIFKRHSVELPTSLPKQQSPPSPAN